MKKSRWIWLGSTSLLLVVTILLLVIGENPLEIGVAGTPTAEASEPGVALTVYNEGTALVRDRRQMYFDAGFNEIAFQEVAASIDPTSVLFRSVTDPEGTIILEQNYEYDLVGASALLDKYLDQDIEVITDDGTRHVGTLLSGRGDLIVQAEDGQVSVIRLDQIREFTFPNLPEGLITRPTLVWQVVAEQAGMHDVEVTYLTGGISWNADYVVLLAADEESIDLDGWITVSNQSGTAYYDAQLKLIAGDLQRLPQEGRAAADMVFEEEMGAAMPSVEEREFFEYHLYEIPRPVTVRNNESKQIEFVSAAAVPAETFYVFDGQGCWNNPWYCGYYGYPQTDPGYGIATAQDVMVLLEFDTDEVEADLPQGNIRLYQEDIDGSALLIGESQIDHTPEGETVRLYVGDAFDIVGERIQTDFRRLSETSLEETFEITIRNHKDEPIEVRVVEHLFRWSEWEIMNANGDYTRLDASTIEFPVSVAADGERTLRFTVRYDWP
ncbi:MAG: DUF4139 domain-containing protein [Anaerolineales bacterium]|nr:DUF4139 domain-containing protein [Anaerolineales bacterium]